MRTVTCLAIAAMFCAAGCRKPQPSPAYTDASGSYTTLLALQGDDAYTDPEMERIEKLLASVPANSSDAAAAAELLAKIGAERKRIEIEAAAQQKMLDSAGAQTAPTEGTRSPEAPIAAAVQPDAGASDFTTGMTLKELREVSQGCFSSAGPLTLRNPDGSEVQAEMFEKMDSTLCNQRWAKYGARFLVFKEEKLVGDFPKTSLTQVTLTRGDAGQAAAPQKAAPAPAPENTPAPIVEPGGDKPPTPLPPPPTPGENTGPAPTP